MCECVCVCVCACVCVCVCVCVLSIFSHNSTRIKCLKHSLEYTFFICGLVATVRFL